MRSKLPLINVFIFLLTACFIAGCSSVGDSENISVSNTGISEITLSNGGGQTVYWYEIVFKNDGTAEYSGDVAPESRGEPKPFGTFTKENERVRYRGRITPEQFAALAKLINDGSFFSMKEMNDIYADAPQTTTTVVRSGTRKKLRNQLGKGGEKLSEIERAISRTADQIKWEKVA